MPKHLTFSMCFCRFLTPLSRQYEWINVFKASSAIWTCSFLMPEFVSARGTKYLWNKKLRSKFHISILLKSHLPVLKYRNLWVIGQCFFHELHWSSLITCIDLSMFIIKGLTWAISNFSSAIYPDTSITSILSNKGSGMVPISLAVLINSTWKLENT